MKKLVCISLFVLIIGVSLGSVSSSSAAVVGLTAQADFLFMQCRKIARESPKSDKGLEALFAMGEYYFLMGDYTHAKECFEEFLQLGKDKYQKLFTYVFLIKIAESQADNKSSKQLLKDLMVLQKNFFVFKKSKQFTFKSPLNLRHRIVYSIEKTEFYVEGDRLAEIAL